MFNELQIRERSHWQQPVESSKPKTLRLSDGTLNNKLHEADVKPWPLVICVPLILVLAIISWALILVPVYFLFVK